MWSDRTPRLDGVRAPFISKGSRLVMLGACASIWMTAALRRWGFRVATHPDGHLYDSKTLRQAVLQTVGRWPERADEPLWELDEGWMDPFAKSYTEVLPSADEVHARREKRDRRAIKQIREADFILVSPEFAQVWRNPKTGNHFLKTPHPQVFDAIAPECRMLGADEVRADVLDIRAAIRELNPEAPIVLATSGIPLHYTLEHRDVRHESMTSMANIITALNDVTDAHDDVRYFPIADLIRFSPAANRYTEDDGRHYHNPAIEYFAWQLLELFGDDDARVAAPDLGWLTEDQPRVATASTRAHATRKLANDIKEEIRQRLEDTRAYDALRKRVRRFL
jgi:hypothetical protein